MKGKREKHIKSVKKILEYFEEIHIYTHIHDILEYISCFVLTQGVLKMSKNSNRRSTVLYIYFIFYGGDDFHGKSQPLEVQWLVHLSCIWCCRYEGNLSL